MNDSLRAHQLAMLGLLDELDRICKKRGIRYMLFAGTLLGAVRHRGFIPWDDDIDVVMPRSEYEKFLAAAEEETDHERFFVQREFSEHWPMFFSKLRLNGTACIERQRPKDRLMHQGVYIDVFPCDALSDSRIKGLLQFAASKAVIARSLYKRGYVTRNLAKKAFMAVCSLLPEKALVRFVENGGRGGAERVHTFFGGAHSFKKNVYPAEWFSELSSLMFEGRQLPVPAHYDELLTKLYGDYMTPLPEAERGKKIHAEIVDLERSYTEYLGVQEDMRFAELTRSIR